MKKRNLAKVIIASGATILICVFAFMTFNNIILEQVKQEKSIVPTSYKAVSSAEQDKKGEADNQNAEGEEQVNKEEKLNYEVLLHEKTEEELKYDEEVRDENLLYLPESINDLSELENATLSYKEAGDICARKLYELCGMNNFTIVMDTIAPVGPNGEPLTWLSKAYGDDSNPHKFFIIFQNSMTGKITSLRGLSMYEAEEPMWYHEVDTEKEYRNNHSEYLEIAKEAGESISGVEITSIKYTGVDPEFFDIDNYYCYDENGKKRDRFDFLRKQKKNKTKKKMSVDYVSICFEAKDEDGKNWRIGVTNKEEISFIMDDDVDTE